MNCDPDHGVGAREAVIKGCLPLTTPAPCVSCRVAGGMRNGPGLTPPAECIEIEENTDDRANSNSNSATGGYRGKKG